MIFILVLITAAALALLFQTKNNVHFFIGRTVFITLVLGALFFIAVLASETIHYGRYKILAIFLVWIFILAGAVFGNAGVRRRLGVMWKR